MSAYICIIKRRADKDTKNDIKGGMEMHTHISNVPSGTMDISGDGEVAATTFGGDINDDEEPQFDDEYYEEENVELNEE